MDASQLKGIVVQIESLDEEIYVHRAAIKQLRMGRDELSALLHKRIMNADQIELPMEGDDNDGQPSAA